MRSNYDREAVAYVLKLWNPSNATVGIDSSEHLVRLTPKSTEQQQLKRDLGASISKLIKKYVANLTENAKLAEAVLSRESLHNERGLEVIKQCENRSGQDLLMLKSLLSESSSDLSIPDFSQSDKVTFGSRRFYETQLRAPWTNQGRSRR